MSKVLITELPQDGYYLTKFLLEKDYEVHGTIRRSSTFNTSRIEDLISEYSNDGKLKLYYSDLLDSSSLNTLISNIRPNEIYNLAAQSHVAVSFENPVFTTQTGTLGLISILEAVRSLDHEIKFYQASSSEMYGGGTKELLNEETIFDPKSPYAASKVFAHILQKFTEILIICFVQMAFCLITNHLSEETFVTRKITRAIGRIVLELQTKLTLGNLDASRDWGFAGDYVEAMWMMLQHDVPDDWVIATGETHTVRENLQN